ncbi:unnamed protein product [Soboliphyme baturini]|uniref:Phospholipase A2 n=1 Tax=Soboliphyme baturini TaxID=241478 RepID=A0A183IB54_9BILA|nr:unnamed protein product [Soboliphyme baturini]
MLALVRSKRWLKDFGDVIKCVTGLSPWKYNGYGCWCGKGGHGTPVDGIDTCCQKHDRCYEALNSKFKCLIYFQPYRWACHNQTSQNMCRAGLCLCDTAAARCFNQYKYPARKKRCPAKWWSTFSSATTVAVKTCHEP